MKRKKRAVKKQQKRGDTVIIIDDDVQKLDIVKCVECPRNNTLVPVKSCTKCELHKNYTCLHKKDVPKIEVIPSNTPNKMNRRIFRGLGDIIRDETLNYYVTTKILKGVRNPEGFKNYTEAKNKFLRGDYKKELDAKEEVITLSEINKKMLLLPTLNGNKYDMTFDGKLYVIDTDNTLLSQDGWKVVYYLYDIYDIDGLGDIKINGVSYKCIFSPIENYPPDLVVLYHKDEDKLIIGSMKG